MSKFESEIFSDLLRRSLAGLWDRLRSNRTRAEDQSARSRRQFLPLIRTLEPRFVLNASAELNTFGQLLVTGDNSADTVRLEIDSSGGLLLTNELNQVIPIVGHPAQADSPLPVSSIPSGQIIFELAGGDDVLDLQIPTGIDVTVIDGDGNDRTQISPVDRGGADAINTLRIESEVIVLDPDAQFGGINRFVLNNDVLSLQGDVVMGRSAGSTSIDLISSEVEIAGNVSFLGDTRLRADAVAFGGVVDVADGTTVMIDAPIVDSTVGSSRLLKTGQGTLILVESNRYTGSTELREGNLRLESSIVSNSDVTVFAGAQLAGDGEIAGRVVANSNAIIAPGAGASIGRLQVGSLNLAPDSILSIQVNGSQSDHLAVESNLLGQVVINDAILDLSVMGAIGPATEFVLIDNDGSEPILGAFRVMFNSDGSVLPQGRTLTEGATVLDSFGASGQAAHITYRGGDGNDVAIVTSGGFEIQSQGVTLVSQNGANLEMRTGMDLAAATAARPVIRPVVGRDGESIRIIGSSATDLLLIDVESLVDTSPGVVPFKGIFVFDGGETGADKDQIQLFSSSALGGVTTTSIDYQFLQNENGIINIESAQRVDPLQIRFSQTESILQLIQTNRIGFQFATSDDAVTASADPEMLNQTLFETRSDGQLSTSVSFLNPTQSLTIRTADGDDSIVIDELGDGFSAALLINAQDGVDTVTINADLNLGSRSATGNLSVDAETIVINGNITTTHGPADGDIRFSSGTSTTIAGMLETAAGRLTLDGGGGVIDAAAGSLSANADMVPIRVVNASRVILGHVLAPTGTLHLGDNQNITGDVTQSVGTRVNLQRLVASVGGSIDLSNPGNRMMVIEDVVAGTDIRMNNSVGDLLVNSLVSHTGSLFLTNAAGSIDLRSAAALVGSIAATADGSSSDIIVGHLLAGEDGVISLIAGDDVLMNGQLSDSIIIADELAVRADNQTADQNAAIALRTNVNDLTAVVNGLARGDISIRESDSIRLASSELAGDASVIQTSNGQIDIRATKAIIVVDSDPSNDGAQRTADPELIAGGEHGRITIVSDESLRLDEAAQLFASQSTVAAVTLQAPLIRFGNEIQIMTGGGVGIARSFAPRPEDLPPVDPNDPSTVRPVVPDDESSIVAFFDPASVATNILTQANINDATGILTIDIGQSGERGLTVNIDWGTETDRFQQIDNVTADDALFVRRGSSEPQITGGDPVLRVEHFYPERDILSSRLNTRDAETEPINVRFSVRHHESILVLADTVAQGESEVEVRDGIASATDNDNPLADLPLSELTFRNGTAAFVIPPLSIPVAFFPVRDVIPEIEEPEVFVRQETTVFLPQSNLQTTETSSSPTTSRDEYLQIRMLSPEPGADDLAPPERLPDDILSGDKLERLFAQLPDGRYEIEYVLGDGNERLILRVDLRDGRPIIPSDEVQGGVLRLIPIDQEDESTDQNNESSDEKKPEIRDTDDDPLDLRTSSTATKSSTAAMFAAGSIVGQTVRSSRRWKRKSVNRLSISRRLIDRIARQVGQDPNNKRVRF